MSLQKLTASDEELKKLYCEDGMRMREIAALFGCSVSAVSQRLQRMNLQARKSYDYPASDKLRAAWVEIGKRGKGRTISEEQRAKQAEKMKGRRARSDYEFGGHEKRRTDGYIKVYVPDHPRCNADGYVMKHILVMEREIGRYLKEGECVHHINHQKDDNRIENLRLMTLSEHMSMHSKERHENRRKKVC